MRCPAQSAKAIGTPLLIFMLLARACALAFIAAPPSIRVKNWEFCDPAFAFAFFAATTCHSVSTPETHTHVHSPSSLFLALVTRSSASPGARACVFVLLSPEALS